MLSSIDEVVAVRLPCRKMMFSSQFPVKRFSQVCLVSPYRPFAGVADEESLTEAGVAFTFQLSSSLAIGQSADVVVFQGGIATCSRKKSTTEEVGGVTNIMR